LVLAMLGHGAGLDLQLAWGYVGLRVIHSLIQAAHGNVGMRSLVWLIANASSLHIDPARIATIGDSVGAHMAAMLSLDERTAQHVRGMVGVYGVYDLPDWWRVTQPPKRTDDPVARLMGRSYRVAKGDYESFSPLHRCKSSDVDRRPNT